MDWGLGIGIMDQRLGYPGRCQVGEEVLLRVRLGLGMRGVCLGIIDMGIGSQEARAAMAARAVSAASPCVLRFSSERSEPLRARDGRLSAGVRIWGA